MQPALLLSLQIERETGHPSRGGYFDEFTSVYRIVVTPRSGEATKKLSLQVIMCKILKHLELHTSMQICVKVATLLLIIILMTIQDIFIFNA